MPSSTYTENLYSNINEFVKINLTLISSTTKNISRFTNTTLSPFIDELEKNILNHFINTFSSNPTNTILFYQSDVNLKYMGFSLYKDNSLDGCIVVGPYLTASVSTFEIQDIAIKNKLSSSIFNSIHDFYKSLPLLNTKKENFLSNSIFYMINNNPYDINKININSLNTDYSCIEDYSMKDCEFAVENIRSTYNLESQLLHYVALGDELRALSLLSKNFIAVDIERVPNAPLRNSKNLYITLNTLLRKAVQSNNIDYYIIHLTSEQVAIKIENCKNLKELDSLLIYMVKSYCKLVNDYSNNKYTTVVSSAVNYIKLNFKNDLTLEDIAQSLYIHPNYLSSRFKSETSLSITDFINDLRIKESMILLKTTNNLIADIAYSVGYNDSKYFSKTFKKLVGTTPSQYRNM
ncbi:helix-turn-helix transcriptional regulator [Romboutsia sp.]|uniref:helix-turn-helix transcriptional regulator n=1 Tax=Romboutsia sp. TaxID=1965302 RepID=UPI003F2FDA02